MPPSGGKYSIDTGALINPWHKTYQPDMFASIWSQHLPMMILMGELCASREVQREIEKQDDDLCAWCLENKAMFEEVDEAVFGCVRVLMDRYERLTTAGRNEADPFVIALAMACSPLLTVVAEEGGGRPDRKRQNIPYICGEQSVRCITFNQFLRETGWREGGT